ncbi:hypothetical protein EDD85DRAFT_472491, partial [Armillaria nabsnona]
PFPRLERRLLHVTEYLYRVNQDRKETSSIGPLRLSVVRNGARSSGNKRDTNLGCFSTSLRTQIQKPKIFDYLSRIYISTFCSVPSSPKCLAIVPARNSPLALLLPTMKLFMLLPLSTSQLASTPRVISRTLFRIGLKETTLMHLFLKHPQLFHRLVDLSCLLTMISTTISSMTVKKRMKTRTTGTTKMKMTRKGGPLRRHW